MIPSNWADLLLSFIISFILNFTVFWNGMLSVYFSSVQLGIKYRIRGIICGFIPIAHLIMLIFIMKVVGKEVKFETEKNKIDFNRKADEICKTKYPLLMVHGVFFRDIDNLNYWGRIPNALIKNGAKIYYGNHASASSIEDSAKELTARIKEIVTDTGAQKVNIIAHSKGGLDCRYAIDFCGAGDYVASLTTINTPHRGAAISDYILNKTNDKFKEKVAKVYNRAFKRLGDENPDFMSAVYDLTTKRCLELEPKLNDAESELESEKNLKIFCQSVGSKLNKATGGKFPLNLTYNMAKNLDGMNDGLVCDNSFKWGEKYTFLTVKGPRGISHGDMIDLNRENIDGFDVREFYVSLVADLKNRGL